MSQISYTREVKEEICNANFDIARKKALLSGFIKINGSLGFKDGAIVLTMLTSNNRIAKYLFATFKEIYKTNITIEYIRNKQLNQDTKYHLTLFEKVDEIIEDLHLDILSDEIPAFYFEDDNLYGGYLAGSFLASGSVNSPISTNYHLEISDQYEGYAHSLRLMMKKAGKHILEPKVCSRRNRFVVYLKKAEQIPNFLVIIGAIESCLKFENMRVDRDVQNSSHRLEMCDMANMKKAIDAGSSQVKMIKALGLSSFSSEKVILVARTRLEYPDASLSELSDIIFDSHNIEISRSNLNHIFRTIKKMYDEEYGD